MQTEFLHLVDRNLLFRRGHGSHTTARCSCEGCKRERVKCASPTLGLWGFRIQFHLGRAMVQPASTPWLGHKAPTVVHKHRGSVWRSNLQPMAEGGSVYTRVN
jgi:hypothetical protein